MTLKRTMCALLAATMILPAAVMAETPAAAAEIKTEESAAQVTAETSGAESYGLADNIQDGVIFHAFCWKYNDITAMLPDIAKAGFTSVQTSPPQATDGTGSWWWFYQPKGFYIGAGAMGTKQDFANLCSEADKYGIKVIADVVANHLAGNHDNIQSDLKDSQFWHDDIGDAKDGNRYSVTHGKIGMPDLNTEHSYVQQCVYNYVQELKSVGVDGIRFDAAKHIGLPSEGDQFWPTVTKDSSLWYYGEILNNPGLSYKEESGQREQAISIMKEYTNYMTVTDSPYGMTLRTAFNSGNAPDSFGNYCGKWMGLANNKLLYWGESHDTWSNNDEWGYSNTMSQNVIDRAYAMAASRNEVTALYFSRPSSSVKDDIKIGVKGSTHFTSPEVAAVNKFHNAMIGKADYFENSNGCAVVTRQGGGAVIAKGSGSGYVSVTNGGGYAKEGTYKDAVSGNEFTVTAETISGTIGDSGIAVIYDEVDNGAVSATPATGTTFTDTITVTLKASNVSSASYKTSEGASGSYKDGDKIVVGASTSEGGTVTLDLTGTTTDGTTSTATYKYTKKGGLPVLDSAGFIFDNSSTNWSTVNAYVYDKSGSSVVSNAQWPGSKMTDCGDGYWKYELDSKFQSSSNVQVIFNNGSSQIPGAQEPGFKMTGTSKKIYTGGTWQDAPETSNLKVSLAASSSSVNVGDSVTLTATATGASGTVTYTFSEGSTQIQSSTKNTATWSPSTEGSHTITVTAKDSKGSATGTTTVKAIKNDTDPTVNVDKASGTSFTSETMSLKLTLANATSGTYSVDDGPVKTFTGSKTITIGEGKIGDSTVTVKTTATNGSTTKTNTYTYEKKYQKKTSSSSGAAASKAAVTEETSGAALASQYKTNAAGLGKQKTISVDGDISDWSSDMLIAQGAANDDPRVYRPNSMYELPVDLYALYGAYDDSNVYLMWEMTNVQDVVAPNDDYPISQGILWQTQELPFFIAVDTGKSDTIGKNGQLQTSGTIWNSGMTITSKFNRLISINTKGGNGPYVYSGDSTGLNPVEIYDAKTSGVKMGYGKGILSKSVTGINGAYGANNNRVVGDVCSNSAAWVDFNTKGHASSSMDFFYELSIPYSELGITKADVTSKGVGIMLVATFGMSGMDCLPYDVSMNDNADQPDTQSQENNSYEKSDADNITASFARIGAGSIDTDTDDTDTDDTDTDTLPLQVNFGTNKSAPQYASTSLTLKGIGYGGTAPYKYQFSVDGTVVKASNTTATYTWTPGTAGSHTIKCVITDSTGKTATVSKSFTAEGSTSDLTNSSKVSTTSLILGNTLTITGAASGGTSPYKYWFQYKKSTSSTWTTLGTKYGTDTTATLKPGAAVAYDVKITVKDNASKTAAKTYTVNVSSPLTNNSKVSATSLTLGKTLTITGAASGGTSPYKYWIRYKKSTSSTWTTLGTEYGTATTATFKPGAAVDYNVKITVKDNAGKTAAKTYTVSVVNPSLTNNSKVSTTNLTFGNKLTITGAAANGTSPYKYWFQYKKSTSSTWSTLGTKYGTDTTATFKPGAAVDYDVKITVKDNAGKTAEKTYKVGVSKAALTNKSTLSSTTLKVGNTIKITGAATGGSGNYLYAYYYKKSTASSWTIVGTEYGTATSASFKPGSAVTYNVLISVKDKSTGEIVTKTYNVKVTS